MKLRPERYKHLWQRPTLRWLLVVAASYLAVLALMMFLENSMIFFPTQAGSWDTEQLSDSFDMQIEDVYFKASDGTRLHGWWVSPEGEDEVRATLLFFHGNAGNLSDRVEFLSQLSRLPARVFVLGYRGYGRSEGSPSEKGVFQDARAAWTILVEELGVRPESIVIFGKSLGGAVAVDLASEVAPAGLIVESSFTSVPDMARRYYPIIPRFLIRTQMDSLSKIGDIACPKLFVHSPADEIVPYEFGRQLYEAASEPKRFYEVSGAPHNNTWLVGGEGYFQTLREFLETVGS